MDGESPTPEASLEPNADPEAVARTIALKRLDARDYSRAELAAFMARKEVPADAIETVLDRFEEVGLVNDARYARSWAESRHSFRGLSKQAIVRELKNKGIASEIIDDAVDFIDRDSELAAARELAAKKARTLQGVDRQKAYRRLAGALARKGYSPGIVTIVVREQLAELDESQADSWDA